MADADAQRNLRPAEDNPWYLLATLHGVPDGQDKERRQARNRVVWNRYYASRWTDKDREWLTGRVAAEELKPFDDQERMAIQQKFANRARGRQIDLPDPAHDVIFNSCCFHDNVSFRHYVFARAYFSLAAFAGHADFDSTTFAEFACFSGATFARQAHFFSATFARGAHFFSATFAESLRFDGATFVEAADFKSATFTGNARFCSATFASNVDFGIATFAGHVDFRIVTFNAMVIFTNADMKAPTDFGGCRFQKYPPQFPGAKLHEGTVWRGVSWPRPPKNPKDAGLFTDAYERLKLEMDRLKKHEDELMFFAKELQCRRVAAGPFRGLPIAAYGALCHYGQSYLLPLGWLLAVILVGAVLFWLMPGWDFLRALGVSTANALGPLGLRKELVDPLVLKDLSRWLQFLTGVQMVMGLVLLFLIGLGLRNRFRMK